MKKASGLIMLLLAALLVAMPVAADTLGVFNGADASILGTKINIQEEVGGMVAAENMTALAVLPEARAGVILLIALAGFGAYAAANYYMSRGYKPMPGAGGDGLNAR